MLQAQQTTHYYDPAMDCKAICFICYTGKGAYWIRTPEAPEGRKRREQKEELLASIAEAIDNGQTPGEVSMAGPRPQRLDDSFYDPGEC